jgi:hypothetical protein
VARRPLAGYLRSRSLIGQVLDRILGAPVASLKLLDSELEFSLASSCPTYAVKRETGNSGSWHGRSERRRRRS